MKTAKTILVWDLPVRVFHWLLVLSFFGAFVTAESERWMLVHITLGYTVAALVVLRLVWGLVGSRTARFASFVRGPGATLAYLRSLLGRQPQRHVGHNPAGAWAIVALLGLAAAVTATGWAGYQDLGGEWLKDLHEGAANVMLALVAVHVAAVLLSSWLHKERLVPAMITGRKPGTPGEGITRAWRPLGVLVLAGVLGFWAWQWSAAPAALDNPASLTSRHDDD